jgi:hypothetical protein
MQNLLNLLQHHAVFTHTFMADDSLLLRAIGIPLLLVYIASVPLGTYNSAIEIPPRPTANYRSQSI